MSSESCENCNADVTNTEVHYSCARCWAGLCSEKALSEDLQQQVANLTGECDALQKRLDTAVDILSARHQGPGALAANDETRKKALEFIERELSMRTHAATATEVK